MIESVQLSNTHKQEALSRAKNAINTVASKSTLFDQARDDSVPRLEDDELTLGRVLGRGGFCVVNEIRSIHLSGKTSDSSRSESNPSGNERLQDRKYMALHCIRDGDARYAIKKISAECKSNFDRFYKGTVDLAIEARYLSVIEHANIIKMRAVAKVSPFDEAFYVVLDRLYDTLEQRMLKWKKGGKGMKGIISKIKKKKGKNDPTITRMLVGYDISSALSFLHSHKIIYRDLKPDNIGFDVRDDVKIFDFGLAKELHPDLDIGDGLYKLTGYTGSLRYMAPEVAKCLPYNLTADSYSFGIIFWQLLALESPYANYSVKMHADLVVEKSYRPAVNKNWPLSWGILLRRCWCSSIGERPSLEEIQSAVRGEIAILRGDEDAVLDLSRRTANSM